MQPPTPSPNSLPTAVNPSFKPNAVPRYKFPNSVGPKFVKHILPWVETFWHAKSRYPLDSELAQKFGLDTHQLLLLHNSKFYAGCLSRRGISRSADADLSAKQVAAISLITNFSDTRSNTVKMLSIDVSDEELNGWYANPMFSRELSARADSILDNVFPEAQAQLARQIKAGSFPALKFYYEITGRAQSPETINVRMAMNRLIESVQKYIKDPAVLQAIANDMQAIPELSHSTSPNQPPVYSPPVAALPSGTGNLSDKYQEFISEA